MLDCHYPQPEQLLAEVKATLEEATAGMEEEKSKLPIATSSQVREEFTNKWAFRIVAAMIKLAPKNKHPKFAAEKEVRLLGNLNLAKATENRFPVQYRLSGSLVVPYIKIPARPKEGPSPIKSYRDWPMPTPGCRDCSDTTDVCAASCQGRSNSIGCSIQKLVAPNRCG